MGESEVKRARACSRRGLCVCGARDETLFRGARSLPGFALEAGMGARAGSNLCNTVGTKKATARAATASGPKAYLRTESRGKGTAGTVAAAMRASAPAGVQTRSKTRVSSPAANGHKFSVKAKASSEASAGTEKIFTVPTILARFPLGLQGGLRWQPRAGGIVLRWASLPSGLSSARHLLLPGLLFNVWKFMVE